MEQFFDKTFKTPNNVIWDNDQLLDFVRRGSQFIHTNYTLTQPLQIDIDSFILETSIRDTIAKCIQIQTAPRVEHRFRNHIFSLGRDSCSIYALDTGEWTVLNDKHTTRDCIFRSVEYARSKVYVFGSRGSPNTYSRYSLVDQKWLDDIEIIGVDGGESISTCYDGNKLIYLVGGCNDGNMLDRVDCFNIETEQFTNIGRLTSPVIDSHSIYHENKIFVIGGFVDAQSTVSLVDILSFDILSKKCDEPIPTTYTQDDKIASCYTGKGHTMIVGGNTATWFQLALASTRAHRLAHGL
ncbi:hypothetical protein SAMD00019534_078970 [Acytostelium subglobosum LB1]|uniref:hypothetical protein n=1 Tax=Acytostelium subglobosum LB1 TaxID=1410327 RepID=UPI0006450864|nr:hypothetical protein SAMD00019534_078970 [Acytostelium subglobosum LB1]GAM24722.1 hypothetical protein SAMD00019534_078970 [Acytostelium subglobosum LB1]|eukprot:XP_012752391.1 hypothetical protein SAMD00019534_078970 [Acytostelium subglobosum LB1]